MKKNTLQLLAGLSLLSLVFTSCSTMRQSTAFSARKYYNFRHHDPVVVLNSKATEHQQTAAPAVAANSNASAVSQPEVQQAPAPVVSTAPVVASATPAKKAHTQTAPGAKPAVTTTATEAPAKPAEVVAAAPKTEMAPTTTNGSGNSSVDPVILIILAILLSPLAVYLYDNRASGRFWLDLVLWLLGVGVLDFYFFFGILWLVAVIYAIVIVTGH